MPDVADGTVPVWTNLIWPPEDVPTDTPLPSRLRDAMWSIDALFVQPELDRQCEIYRAERGPMLWNEVMLECADLPSNRRKWGNHRSWMGAAPSGLAMFEANVKTYCDVLNNSVQHHRVCWWDAHLNMCVLEIFRNVNSPARVWFKNGERDDPEGWWREQLLCRAHTPIDTQEWARWQKLRSAVREGRDAYVVAVAALQVQDGAEVASSTS